MGGKLTLIGYDRYTNNYTMRKVHSFKDWCKINEGGWSTTATQDTVLTPKLLKIADETTLRFEKDFNKYLKNVGLPEVDFIKPIGSGSWYEDDIINQPDKVYGDIDYMVSYPLLGISSEERKDEIETNKTYNSEMLKFVQTSNLPYIDEKETSGSSSPGVVRLMLKLEFEGKGVVVQVDIVVTFGPYEEWSIARYTPIRNVKGFVSGKIYKSLGDALGISIQERGVRAKFQGNVLAPWNKRAGVQEKAITMNFGTFLKDIADFFYKYEGGDGEGNLDAYLKMVPGLDGNKLSIEGMCKGIRALANTLEANGTFGNTLKYNNAQEFLNQFVRNYDTQMMEVYNAKKFEKAASPTAHAAVAKVRSLITEYVGKVKYLLK